MQPQSLPDQIAEWLILEISEERLAPGERIREQYVAEQCNVSRGPVREAFQAVEKLGLIRLLPRRGAVVSPLDIHELKELFDIRAALTHVAVCRAIKYASVEQLEKLLTSAKKLQLLAADKDKFFIASNAIGEEFLTLTNSERLTEMMRPLHMQIQRYRHHGFSNIEARKVSARAFLEIAKAMLTRNEQQTQQTVESVTGKLRSEVEKAFEVRPENSA